MKNRIMRIAMTLSMLIIPALVTGCGYSEKQIQQELSYQDPDQKELHEILGKHISNVCIYLSDCIHIRHAHTPIIL